MSIGERLKKLMKSSKYTQKTLSEELGVSIDVVGNWCRGVTPISIDALSKVATILNTTTDYILTGQVYPNVTTPVTSNPASSDLDRLDAALAELNEEGREKLLDYAADLVASGRYKKANPARLGQKA